NCCFCLSSRRGHTRLVSDWSSDVCSSDLTTSILLWSWRMTLDAILEWIATLDIDSFTLPTRSSRFDPKSVRTEKPSRNLPFERRSEERRVGKECRSRRSEEN